MITFPTFPLPVQKYWTFSEVKKSIYNRLTSSNQLLLARTKVHHYLCKSAAFWKGYLRFKCGHGVQNIISTAAPPCAFQEEFHYWALKHAGVDYRGIGTSPCLLVCFLMQFSHSNKIVVFLEQIWYGWIFQSTTDMASMLILQMGKGSVIITQ